MSNLALPPPLASDVRFAQLCELLEETLDGIDLKPMLVYLVDTMKPDLLPVLAEQFSMLDETVWSLAESEDARRSLVKGSVSLHRYKGTPWSLRELCRRLGLGEIQIAERLSGQTRNGAIKRDGIHLHGAPKAWAQYRVFLQHPITNDQASKLRRALIEHAPARCNLVSLDYQAVANRHNGVIHRDGQYNRGSA
jgi:hypothetical protein